MEIKDLLSAGFRFKKNLGQNFITDGNLLRAVVLDAGITQDDTVVEIGTGAATLTKELCKQAKKVITFELDRDLEKIIKSNLDGFDNYELHFADVLKLSDEDMKVWVPDTFKVVANLPYYVTTPMIMRFLESGLNVTSLTLMMQKEVAERLTAKHDTPEYGAITVAVNAVADVTVTRIIDRRIFFPAPNVDSALVRIDINKGKYAFKDFATFKKTARAAFLMRRKTLANNLIATFPIDKPTAEILLEECGFGKTIRGEALSVEDMIRLSDRIYSLMK